MKTFDERNLLPEILPDDPMHQAKDGSIEPTVKNGNQILMQ